MNQTTKPLIIVAEDDKDLSTLIATQLEVAGMQSQVCHEASHVGRFLKNNFANLILLDVHLPDDTGFNLMSDLRKAGDKTPIIFLTGENNEVKKVNALEMGGDDYITKPFGFPELIHGSTPCSAARKQCTIVISRKTLLQPMNHLNFAVLR